MAKLLAVKHGLFKKEMDSKFEDEDAVSSLDTFDTFVEALSKETNVLSLEDLKALVFNQFKSYGDFDKTMNAVAENVSGIQKSTQDAIAAIDNNDATSLKSAYSQLKEYEKRIEELEKDIYTDHTTGVYNRKYLFNYELDQAGKFKKDGCLVHVSINNFLQINKEHGYEAGDKVLKYISKLLQKNLKSVGVHLIRYMGVQFIALSKDAVSAKVEKICRDTVDDVLNKKFRAEDGGKLHIELQLNSQAFSKGQGFDEVYKKL